MLRPEASRFHTVRFDVTILKWDHRLIASSYINQKNDFNKINLGFNEDENVYKNMFEYRTSIHTLNWSDGGCHGDNFQAAATAPDGTPLSSVEIGVQIEVVKGTEEGDVVYTETHTVTTMQSGYFK